MNESSRTVQPSNDFGLALGASDKVGSDSNQVARETGSAVIPVVGEELVVGKRIVESGKVNISKRVHQDEEIVDVPTIEENVEVERVPVNQFVDIPPDVRYEGETMIVPVLREEVVVQKRLMLVEELRITKRRVQTTAQQSITLLREEVNVERIAGDEE